MWSGRSLTLRLAAVQQVADSHHPQPSRNGRPTMKASQTKKQRRTNEPQFVLPKPPRHAGTLVVGDAEGATGAVTRRKAEGLVRAGVRMMALLECQDRFLAEARVAARELQHGLPAADSVSSVGILHQVLDWCEAVQADMTVEARRAALGQQAVDLLLLCQDVQHDLNLAGRFTPDAQQPLLVLGHSRHAVWGRIDDLGLLLKCAIELMAQRTAGHGAISVEVQDDSSSVAVTVRGSGATIQQPSTEAVDAFRAAAEGAEAMVQPDELGPGSAGLVLRFHGVSGNRTTKG
jgi:hypothetical protein